MVSFQHDKITKYLISKGANINNTTTVVGITITNIILTTVKRNNFKLAQFLAEKGAKLNSVSSI